MRDKFAAGASCRPPFTHLSPLSLSLSRARTRARTGTPSPQRTLAPSLQRDYHSCTLVAASLLFISRLRSVPENSGPRARVRAPRPAGSLARSVHLYIPSPIFSLSCSASLLLNNHLGPVSLHHMSSHSPTLNDSRRVGGALDEWLDDRRQRRDGADDGLGDVGSGDRGVEAAGGCRQGGRLAKEVERRSIQRDDLQGEAAHRPQSQNVMSQVWRCGGVGHPWPRKSSDGHPAR
eukprot:364509-Chlamydomonas_euryale.AAC.4